jgi:uncharacterized integral membrane protein
VEWTIGHLLPALLAAVVGLVLVGLVEGVKAVRKRVTA